MITLALFAFVGFLLIIHGCMIVKTGTRKHKKVSYPIIVLGTSLIVIGTYVMCVKSVQYSEILSTQVSTEESK